MLEIKNISAGYDKKPVLFNVSAKINDGSITLLIGSNGSGKSTLLKTIYGIEGIWKDGEVFFDGLKISHLKTSELISKGLLYIPQRNALFEDLTIMENLEMAGFIIKNKKILKKRIAETLFILKSITSLKKKAMDLSGGERQLLAFAMANIHRPRLIMCDEPFIGLSPQNIKFVISVIKDLNKKNGTAFLIVEHHVKEALEIADTIIGLKLGSVFNNIKITASFDVNEINSVFI